MHNCIMGATIPASIESLEIKDCQSLEAVYFPIIAGQNRLRKFKISFPPPDEAKERAYRYWRHYVFQKQLTLDFLRCDTIELDELDIRGDFGDPALNPVEFSGLSTDLFFAVEAQAKSLVRLMVVNHNIDFSLAEIGSILAKAENLTQLGLTCRAFTYQDQFGHWIPQGLGVSSPSHSLSIYTYHLPDPGHLRALPPLPRSKPKHLLPHHPAHALQRPRRGNLQP